MPKLTDKNPFQQGLLQYMLGDYRKVIMNKYIYSKKLNLYQIYLEYNFYYLSILVSLVVSFFLFFFSEHIFYEFN